VGTTFCDKETKILYPVLTDSDLEGTGKHPCTSRSKEFIVYFLFLSKFTTTRGPCNVDFPGTILPTEHFVFLTIYSTNFTPCIKKVWFIESSTSQSSCLSHGDRLATCTWSSSSRYPIFILGLNLVTWKIFMEIGPQKSYQKSVSWEFLPLLKISSTSTPMLYIHLKYWLPEWQQAIFFNGNALYFSFWHSFLQFQALLGDRKWLEQYEVWNFVLILDWKLMSSGVKKICGGIRSWKHSCELPYIHVWNFHTYQIYIYVALSVSVRDTALGISGALSVLYLTLMALAMWVELWQSKYI
jgi:hypothetical protein